MKAILAFFVAITFTTATMAQDTDPLAGLGDDGSVTVSVEEIPDGVVPSGTPCINKADNKRYQCFTLEEMKQLQFFKEELAYYATGYVQYKQKVEFLEDENFQLRTQIVSLEDDRDVLLDEKERLFLKWKDENKLRLEAENKLQFGNALAWSLAGIFAATALGTGLALGLSR